MTGATIVKTIYLQATPKIVWSYLTEPDRLARWFHESDLPLTKVGTKYNLLRDNPSEKGPKMCSGEVLEVIEHQKLVQTFTHEWLKGVLTTIVWELEPAGTGTQLTMTHSGFENVKEDMFTELSNHDKGWDEGFIRLRRVAATF